MPVRLSKGETIVFDRGVRIQNVEQTVVAADSPTGAKGRPIEIDWDRRIVWVERKPGKWVWVPFEKITFGVGAPPRAEEKKR